VTERVMYCMISRTA